MNPIQILTGCAILALPTASFGANLYLDYNGTAPGFGMNGTANPKIVDPTAATWNTDPSGGAGGTLTSASNGDVLKFGLEGTGGVRFDWINYGGIEVGGIHTYRTTGSTATINRMQKQGGGFLRLQFTDGGTIQTDDTGNSFWWDFGTAGNISKTGSEWLAFGDGGPKIDGTLTITDGYVVVRQTGLVDANSSFALNGNGLRFTGGMTGTATVGTLSGTGTIVRDGTGGLGALTIATAGFDLIDGAANGELKFGWGASAALNPSSTTMLEILKTGGTTDADQVLVDWSSKTLALDGTLEVTLVAGSTPLTEGDTFDLLSDNLTGNFSNVILPALDGDLEWDTSDLTVNGTIMVIPEPSTTILLSLLGLASLRVRRR